MAQISLPGYREPLTDADGNISRAWWRFFQGLATLTGGGSIPDLSAIIAAIADLRGQVQEQEVSQQPTAALDALQQIEELAARQLDVENQTGSRSKLAELEDLLFSLQTPAVPNQVESFASPTLLNSWVYFGSNSLPGYYKDSFGRVHLRGFVKSGTIGNAIFTLPVGYRPALREFFAVVSNDLFGACYVDSNGDVIAYKGSNVYFSLDGISFRPA